MKPIDSSNKIIKLLQRILSTKIRKQKYADKVALNDKYFLILSDLRQIKIK